MTHGRNFSKTHQTERTARAAVKSFVSAPDKAPPVAHVKYSKYGVPRTKATEDKDAEFWRQARSKTGGRARKLKVSLAPVRGSDLTNDDE